MEKLSIWVTGDIGCGAELPMREGLGWAEIGSGARVVGKDDLGNAVKNFQRECGPTATWTCKGLGTMLLTSRYIKPVFQEPHP